MIKDGNDKNIYISKRDKNGVYKWLKIQNKKSPDEYYKQFPAYKKPLYDTSFFINSIPKLQKELNKIGVKFFLIKWKTYNDSPFEYEYFDEDVLSLLPVNTNYIYVSERMIYASSLNKNGKIYIMHGIAKDKIKKFNQILIKYFPGRTKGYENESECIKIELIPKKRLISEKEKTSCFIDLRFKDRKLSIDTAKLIKIFQKNLSKFGRVSMYDEVVTGGLFYFEFSIFKGKEKAFEQFFKNKRFKDIPEIDKVKITYA
ncbi:MAG: hypothetical protein Faunusvirus13_19 [Faunusvirus sp.]|jgi:hypothetical protein|uniref:Uncharacterized protein n=1 Tax=Faunusvirus sp. TaxID=2487766 RepID=A0A3G4ZWZ6_9VIRU|nr:MAG: hypothetical protein Faunusvirus13_19 [Faunusvirus sp.]